MRASAAAHPRTRRPPRTRPARLPRPSAARPVEPTEASPPLDLERLAAGWQRALDSAYRALAAPELSSDAGDARRALRSERDRTAALIADVARVARITPVPWLSPVPVTARMLGLPPHVRGCLFDLDGVLTDSGKAHALAWAEVFDDLLLRLTESVAWHFIPFDPVEDYGRYLEGRSRLDGIGAFLDSRGIRLPAGSAGDPADADTAFGLARRKGEALERVLLRRGVAALGGARRYLEAAGRAGIARGVVSASASTSRMLRLAGLAPLVEGAIDADTVRIRQLRPRPHPDVLIAACEQLGVSPEAAVTFTRTPAGVAAGCALGMAVVGVGAEADGELLRAYGAGRVVPSLTALVDPAVRAAA